MPLVPFNFPVGKNVLCLIDSGAGSSLMPAGFMLHENIGYRQKYNELSYEGACGRLCLEVIGITEPFSVTIPGITKRIELEFSVIREGKGEGKMNSGRPIVGINLFEQVNVGFGKIDGRLYTIIKE